MDNLILVTGPNGFIGHHLVEALVRKGKRVRCLAHAESNIDRLEKLNIEIVYGDLLDKASLQEAVKDVKIVYHLAAQVRPLRSFYGFNKLTDFYDDVNVLGTRNLAEVCCEHNIERFIFYSSIAVAGLSEGHTESTACEPITTYGKSKLKAEEYLMGLFESRAFPVIILRPGQVFGPGDIPMLTLFRFVKRGILPSFGPGTNRIPFCYVDNLVEATLSAETKGAVGEKYYLFDEHQTLRGFSTMIAKSQGVDLSNFYIPKGIAKFGVAVKEIIERLFRFRICPLRMDISSETIKIATNNWTFSNDKSVKELDYRSGVSLREGVDRTVRWYRDHSFL